MTTRALAAQPNTAQPGVKHHLSTKTNYASRLPILSRSSPAPSIHNTPDPEGMEPVHLWFLSRHGTRWPTKERMEQISRMTQLFKDAHNVEEHPWIRGWQPPFVHMGTAGGELHSKGEDEMWSLARRLSSRFSSLLDVPYLPHRFPVISSQVHRAAASASAFASGFFPPVNVQNEAPQDLLAAQWGTQAGAAAAAAASSSNHSDTGLTRPQAVAISMLPKHADPLLRFYDVCPAYAQREVWLQTWLPGWMEEQWATLIPALQERLGLTRSMAASEVEDIWQLCQFEAGVQGITNQACSLLSESDVRLLEWVDDVSLLESHSYGGEINYRIAAPLLSDMRHSLEDAARSAATSATGVASKRMRLLFAHCETLVPLATLLGLFKPGLLPAAAPTLTDGQHPSARLTRKMLTDADAHKMLADVDAVEDLAMRQTHKEGHGIQALTQGAACVPKGWRPLVSDDPARSFRGGFVSPFSANMGLMLYKHTTGDAAARPSLLSDFKVRLLYNEQVLTIPGCALPGNSSSSYNNAGSHVMPLDCDLEAFLQLTQVAAEGGQALEALCATSEDEVGRGVRAAIWGHAAPAT